MKRSTFFIMLTLLFPLAGICQNPATIVDDVYFKPGDSKNITKSTQTENNTKTTSNQTLDTKQRPNYKNGAKEIIYIERKTIKPTALHDTVYVVGQPNDRAENINKKTIDQNSLNDDNSVIIHDTIYVVDQANDSTENNTEDGHYLNGFKGSETDLEYAERIRRFHNPKYTIFIGDPRYNDIYFLNNSDWNVYVDDSYAYVTPTWTNPYWSDYYFSPFSYGGYGWGYGWNPWGYNNFYGGFGYGGFGDYYGYGYPYYGYGDYYGYGYGYNGYYGGMYGYNHKNKNYDEGNRRGLTNYNGSDRLGGTRSTTAASTMIGGGYNSTNSRNQYTVVSGTSRSNTATNPTTSNITRSSIGTTRTVSNQSNGIGIVRISNT